LANWIKKEYPTFFCLQETHLIERKNHWLRVKPGRRFTMPMVPENRQG
jgi:hypothetical protein